MRTFCFYILILLWPVFVGANQAPCPQILAELASSGDQSSELQVAEGLREILKELKVSSLEEMKASLEVGEYQPLPALSDIASGSVRKALKLIYAKVEVKKELLKDVVDQLIEEKEGQRVKRREARNVKKKVDGIKKRFNTALPNDPVPPVMIRTLPLNICLPL